jgi:hypothetical protein
LRDLCRISQPPLRRRRRKWKGIAPALKVAGYLVFAVGGGVEQISLLELVKRIRDDVCNDDAQQPIIIRAERSANRPKEQCKIRRSSAAVGSDLENV